MVYEKYAHWPVRLPCFKTWDCNPCRATSAKKESPKNAQAQFQDHRINPTKLTPALAPSVRSTLQMFGRDVMPPVPAGAAVHRVASIGRYDHPTPFASVFIHLFARPLSGSSQLYEKLCWRMQVKPGVARPFRLRLRSFCAVTIIAPSLPATRNRH